MEQITVTVQIQQPEPAVPKLAPEPTPPISDITLERGDKLTVRVPGGRAYDLFAAGDGDLAVLDHRP